MLGVCNVPPASASRGAPVRQQAPATPAVEAPAPPTPDDGARHGALAGILARSVDERARTGGPLLQRLIAVNVAGIPHTDYAIMKQVHQLNQAVPQTVTKLSSATDFSGMAPGEDLFIVSHGDSATGNLRDIEPANLVKWLNHKDRGIPAHFGKIVVLSCYGGMPKSGGKALAEKIAVGINHHGHTVEGALGFSFGTAEFARGATHSSVLPETLRVFYTADDLSAMCKAWGDLEPNHDAGVLTAPLQGLEYVNQYTTIRANLVAKHGEKKADGLILTLVTHLKTRTKAIEDGLRLALSQATGTTVQTKLASLNAPGIPAANVVQWNALLAEQYRLFRDYYLWANPDTAFASF